MIEIADLAAQARAAGVTRTHRHDLGGGVSVDFDVTADGTVTCRTPGWEPVIADARITGFRPVPVDPVTPTQMGAVALHEFYKVLRKGGFSILAACAYLAAMGKYSGEENQEGHS